MNVRIARRYYRRTWFRSTLLAGFLTLAGGALYVAMEDQCSSEHSPEAHRIVVYSKEDCPYCRAAKLLLQEKGILYETIDIGVTPTRRREMVSRSRGRRTVPQIFVGDFHIGGFEDLLSLESRGKLDRLLGR